MKTELPSSNIYFTKVKFIFAIFFVIKNKLPISMNYILLAM